MATEKSKLKPTEGVNVNYTQLHRDEADSYWVGIAANVLGINVYDTEGHGEKSSGHDGHVELVVGERISPEEYYMGNNTPMDSHA